MLAWGPTQPKRLACCAAEDEVAEAAEVAAVEVGKMTIEGTPDEASGAKASAQADTATTPVSPRPGNPCLLLSHR